MRIFGAIHGLGRRQQEKVTAAAFPHGFGADPGQQQAGQVAEGELVAATGDHVEREGTVDALVLVPVARIGAGQGAERHRPRHEAQIGGRFAGRNQLVHLIGLGPFPP